MFSNYISGGQVFLHKIRMLKQVLYKTLLVSMLAGLAVGWFVYEPEYRELDWPGFWTYKRAELADGFDDFINTIRPYLRKSSDYASSVAPRSNHRVFFQDYTPRGIFKDKLFRKAHRRAIDLFKRSSLLFLASSSGFFLVIVIMWGRFGRTLKSERKDKDGPQILTSKDVGTILRQEKKASSIRIGDMPLVKDMETRHFLVTGSTGSGKTNLMHNLLGSVEAKEHPAIVIDQTGEMISKYYNSDRGDVILNPFDRRSSHWDFNADCSTREDVDNFAKILIKFGKKAGSEDFWDSAAKEVFVDTVMTLREENRFSLSKLIDVICSSDNKSMYELLTGKDSRRHFVGENAKVSASIISVLVGSVTPLRYFVNAKATSKAELVSLKKHLEDIDQGSKKWFFLSMKPSSRRLTLPIISALLELSLLKLMDRGISQRRKLWFVLDELAALGKLPALSGIMTEGRKYGACVIAGMQSLNQLYDNYGHYQGSVIFGQFGTSFFFRNQEPQIAEMIRRMCGEVTYTRHQKNTSFGANEFRDGVSYNEQEKIKSLVSYHDLASLKVGQCYLLLPEPKVRLSKLQVPETKRAEKNEGFKPSSLKEELENVSQKTEPPPENMTNEVAPSNSDTTDTSDTDADVKGSDRKVESPEESRDEPRGNGSMVVSFDSSKKEGKEEGHDLSPDL